MKGSQLPAKNTRRTSKEASLLGKTWNELERKPASCKKHETNFQGSRLPAKNTRRTFKEATFPQKTWDELSRKPPSRKKHGTNFQGSWFPGKNMERTRRHSKTNVAPPGHRNMPPIFHCYDSKPSRHMRRNWEYARMMLMYRENPMWVAEPLGHTYWVDYRKTVRALDSVNKPRRQQ